MITQEIAYYHIERNIDFGEPLPPEVERYMELHPESRNYLDKMKMVASTLKHIEVEPPSPVLAESVMDHIRLNEEAKQRSVWHSLAAPFLRVYKSLYNFGREFQIDPVLSREAWPTVFATLSIFIGVFVWPMVESGKADQLRASVEDKVITLTDEAYEQVESMAKSINEFAAGFIRNVSGEEKEGKKEPGDDLGLKYKWPVQRNLLLEHARQT